MVKAREVTPWEPPAELFGDEFTKGLAYQNWRPAGTADWLLIYTRAGGGRFVSPAGALETRAGDAVLYAPGELHDYSTSPRARRWRLLWVHFQPRADWARWLRWPAAPHGLRALALPPGEVRARFVAAFERMNTLSRRPLPGAAELASNALEEALLWTRVAVSEDRWLAMDARVRRAIDHLTARAAEPFSLAGLARHCGVSVPRLAFLFKQETGTTPQRFLERQRLQRAGRLLRLTNLSVAEVAERVGYQDPFYFSNRFRRAMGKSPSAWGAR